MGNVDDIEEEMEEEKEKKNRKGKKKIPQSEIAIRLFQDKIEEEQGPELFHDQFKIPLARIFVDDILCTYPIKSAEFKALLSKMYWDKTGVPMNSNSIKTTLEVLIGMALFDGQKLELYNRVGWKGDAIYYDLTNTKWQGVKIDADGWIVIDTPPNMFRRYKHQTAQVLPKRGGNIIELMDLLKIEKRHRQLWATNLISMFIPGIPHPVYNSHGPQGSIKSTTAKAMRRIVDPSALPILSIPKDKTEAVQQLSHHWCPFYDNVTTLQQWLSDLICRAVTGDGFSKRELFSDDEDVIYSFQRCVGLNGINIVATKPDIMDRSLYFVHDRISKDKRMPERKFWRLFENLLPGTLGSCFDILSRAMSFKHQIELKELPRMADFAEWGEAISRALGYKDNSFVAVYFKSIGIQNREALEYHIIGPVILELVKTKDWEGKPSELLSEMLTIAEEFKINTKDRAWPKAPNALSRRLKEIKSNLEDEEITLDMGHSGNRYIKITRKRLNAKKPSKPSDRPSGTVQTVRTDEIPSGRLSSSTDDKDDKDGISRYRSFNAKNDNSDEIPNIYQAIQMLDEGKGADIVEVREAVGRSNYNELFKYASMQGLIHEIKKGYLKLTESGEDMLKPDVR